MPLFHFIGNFTNGTGTQPVYLNDVNGIVLYKGVFHQFGQCGRGHAVSLFCGVHHIIKEQFVRFFSKAPVTDAGVERLPAAHEVQDMAEEFERLVLQAEQDHPSFKKLTLATTQGFFQTKFREGARGNDPMQAAVDGFAEFFLPALPKPDAGATSTAPSDIMRSASQQAALTRQFSRGGSRAAAPGLRAPHTI